MLARACLILLLLTTPCLGEGFSQTVDRFLEEVWFPFRPSLATAAGFHEYDHRLQDRSRGALEAQIESLLRYRDLFATARTDDPNQDRDRRLVLSQVDAALLELREVRMWERDPDQYSSALTYAAFVLISRSYGTPEERLGALIEREQAMPALLVAGRENLKTPPRVYTEIAIMQLPGILSFFERDVPQAFEEVRDNRLRAEFESTNQAVLEALREYQQFLETDLLPRSTGDFRLGTELYRKKLLYEEMIDTPLDELLKLGYADLRRNQKSFQEAAARYRPGASAAEVLAEISGDYPEPHKLLDAFKVAVNDSLKFIRARDLVTIPSDVRPILQETPPFLRALTFASMDTPGPYETEAKEAFFNVTLPEPDWSPEEVEGHMAAFHYGVVASTGIHEAYPGHYTQFLWVGRAPTKVRKLFGAMSNAEGWAHYTEEMLMEQGFGVPEGGDKTSPEFLKLKLGQLQDALLRNARYVVAIEMHTGVMTFDEAVDFFVAEGYQSRANALREVRRGTSDPTYLIYTLGKLRIFELRDEVRRRRGESFSLREFHDHFLAEGFPPLPLVREALLR